MARARILLIEDDPWLGPSLVEFLRKEGYEVTLLDDPAAFCTEILSAHDLLVLDLILPHVPGEEILRRIRRDHPRFPVLVLTAKGRIEDKRACFELGADDYLVKPFDVEELALRIRALLRRSGGTHGTEVLPGLEVDLERGLVRRDGREVRLSRRAWDLLCYLLRNRGRIVSKEEILAEVWKGVTVTEESVRAYIKELRKVLPPGSIETVRGRGYRFRER